MSASTSLLSFLRSSRPDTVTASTSESDIPSLSSILFSSTTYTETEKTEQSQWLTTSTHLTDPSQDAAKHAERLDSLNTHLSARTTLLGSKPSVADVALYHSLMPLVRQWSPDERTGEKGYPYIVRWLDFVQNSPVFRLEFGGEGSEEKVDIDVDDVRFIRKPIDAKEEKERKKKEKAEALAAASTTNGTPTAQKDLPLGKGKPDSSQATPSPIADGASKPTKKEKKEKVPKPTKALPKETPPTPSLIDLRVGHILECIPHPNADSLYVSTIACGDPPGTDNTSTHVPSGQTVRTVCSGLNGLIPIEEMQNRKIIAVCNLKPVTMRGIKSAAMVLAASPRVKEGEEDPHKGPVELVSPPEGAEAGARVCFEGWEGEPDGVLNPKKKIWEMCQVGFTTTERGEVAFDAGTIEKLPSEGETKGVGRLVTKGGGVCRVQSLKGATVR